MARTPDGLALAHVTGHDAGPRQLALCEERRVEGDVAPSLAGFVREHGLGGGRCFWVLSPEAYSLRLVDAPQVEPAELEDAARWLVKDLIDFDVDDAVIDVLELPGSGVHARAAKVYVVAARREAVREASAAAEAAGLELAGVGIQEQLLLDLVDAAESETRGAAVLQIGAKEGLLSIGAGGCLYVARPLSVGSAELDSSGLLETPEGAYDFDSPTPVLEHLLLEVQRSLDYYESSFEQSPVKRLWIAPCETDLSLLAPYLTQNLSVDVRPFELGQVLECPHPTPQALQARCLTAVAAAGVKGSRPTPDLRETDAHLARVPLSARTILHASAAFTLLLLAIAGHARWQESALDAELARLEGRRQLLVERVGELRAQDAARGVDDQLAARVRSLEADRDARARLLETLTRPVPSDGGHFTGVLDALARTPVPDLWLREIRVFDEGRGLALTGSSLDPEGVPRFLRGLGRHPVFAGTHFRTLRLDRSEDGPPRFDFALSTAAEGGS